MNSQPLADKSRSETKTRILILGGGFGGVYAALQLERMMGKHADYEITLVSETNYLLFTPMLHEVAASDLDLTNIINPIRKMLKRTNFVEAIVEKIDLPERKVTIGYAIPRRHREVGYDKLLIAMGSLTHFIDGPGLRENAVTMKTLHDAVFLRNRMIALLEDAAHEEDAERRKAALTFVIAGGGFAGVETIGGMNDFLADALEFYPTIDKQDLRVILIHPGKVLLPEFKEKLGKYTAEKLKESGIDVRLETKVTAFDGNNVQISPGEPIPAFSLIWAAGVTPPPEIEAIPVKKDRGRLVTNGCMEIEQFPGVWCVGDCASIPDPKTGKPFPATAQHAIRQGKWVAKNMIADIRGSQQRPFTFTTLGQLAAIGRRRGAANVLGFNFSGFPAWFFWRTTYLWKLPRLEKKIRVALDWTLDLFFSKDIVQYVTLKQVEELHRPAAAAPVPHAPPHPPS